MEGSSASSGGTSGDGTSTASTGARGAFFSFLFLFSFSLSVHAVFFYSSWVLVSPCLFRFFFEPV